MALASQKVVCIYKMTWRTLTANYCSFRQSFPSTEGSGCRRDVWLCAQAAMRSLCGCCKWRCGLFTGQCLQPNFRFYKVIYAGRFLKTVHSQIHSILDLQGACILRASLYPLDSQKLTVHGSHDTSHMSSQCFLSMDKIQTSESSSLLPSFLLSLPLSLPPYIPPPAFALSPPHFYCHRIDRVVPNSFLQVTMTLVSGPSSFTSDVLRLQAQSPQMSFSTVGPYSVFLVQSPISLALSLAAPPSNLSTAYCPLSSFYLTLLIVVEVKEINKTIKTIQNFLKQRNNILITSDMPV